MIVSVQDGRERFLGEVAARDEPFVVMFDQHRAGEPDQACVVGEDADDVSAAADLAVDALERVGAAQLGPVLARQRVEAEQVGLGVERELGDLRRDGLEALERDTVGRAAATASWRVAEDRSEESDHGVGVRR